jgi:hypothetical protein
MLSAIILALNMLTSPSTQAMDKLDRLIEQHAADTEYQRGDCATVADPACLEPLDE